MATATATRVDTRQRSIELAEERGYWSSSTGPGRTVDYQLADEGRRLVSLTMSVPSASECDVWHTVVYDASRDDAQCDCHSGAWGHSCWHRGVAVKIGRYVARLARLGWPED